MLLRKCKITKFIAAMVLVFYLPTDLAQADAHSLTPQSNLTTQVDKQLADGENPREIFLTSLVNRLRGMQTPLPLELEQHLPQLERPGIGIHATNQRNASTWPAHETTMSRVVILSFLIISFMIRRLVALFLRQQKPLTLQGVIKPLGSMLSLSISLFLCLVPLSVFVGQAQASSLPDLLATRIATSSLSPAANFLVPPELRAPLLKVLTQPSPSLASDAPMPATNPIVQDNIPNQPGVYIVKNYSHMDGQTGNRYMRALYNSSMSRADYNRTVGQILSQESSLISQQTRTVRWIRTLIRSKRQVSIAIEIDAATLYQFISNGRQYLADLRAIMRKQGVSNAQVTADKLFTLLYGPAIYVYCSGQSIDLLNIESGALRQKSVRNSNEANQKMAQLKQRSAQVGETAAFSYFKRTRDQILTYQNKISADEMDSLVNNFGFRNQNLMALAKHILALDQSFLNTSSDREGRMADELRKRSNRIIVVFIGSAHVGTILSNVPGSTTWQISYFKTPEPPFLKSP